MGLPHVWNKDIRIKKKSALCGILNSCYFFTFWREILQNVLWDLWIVCRWFRSSTNSQQSLINFHCLECKSRKLLDPFGCKIPPVSNSFQLNRPNQLPLSLNGTLVSFNSVFQCQWRFQSLTPSSPPLEESLNLLHHPAVGSPPPPTPSSSCSSSSSHSSPLCRLRDTSTTSKHIMFLFGQMNYPTRSSSVWPGVSPGPNILILRFRTDGA